MPHLSETVDVVVILFVMLAAGGFAAAWGVNRYQSEGDWVGGAVAAVGLVVALYAPLSALFGWPPLDWLRG